MEISLNLELKTENLIEDKRASKIKGPRSPGSGPMARSLSRVFMIGLSSYAPYLSISPINTAISEGKCAPLQ